ncbi:MAG: exodeoxyribonuclease V subunit gamma [Candidatus Tectimicrobiota bacterium]
MLHVHYSNRLEILADQLAERLRQPCGSPLLPDIIIVQSTGMARWLSLHLAQRLGICAQIHFPFPAAFVWDLYRRLLRSVPEMSPFAPDVLTWRIMALLACLDDAPCWAPLQAYCAEGDDATRFALAAKIAEVFDHYLVYRPDWIRQWEHGAEDHWQAALWRRLVTDQAPHRVQLQAQLLQVIQPERLAHADLPTRLSLIGIPTMPPAYLEVFARLATCLDVQGFFLQPCREPWQDGRAEQENVQRKSRSDTTGLSKVTKNRLLASMGTLGRDFLGLVQVYQPQTTAQFLEPGDDTLLHSLQSDILHGRDRGTATWPRTPLSPHDRSIQVHVCHSRMREVEVLYDQLVGLCERLPDLSPADILVMTPDIDAYAPLIEAVFTPHDRNRVLPFSLADRNPRLESPLITGFFALLELASSRYAVNQLCTLLELPAVQYRFGLAAGDLPLVQRWLRETAVRWGIDEEGRAALGLPAIREHTWQAGLDRLLLGYALPGDHRQCFADLLPYEAVEGTEAQILGCLHTFAAATFRLATTLREARPAAAWVSTLTALLDQFFQPDETEELDIQAIRSALQHLQQTVTQASFEASLSLDVIAACLRRSLDVAVWSTRFLTGGVTCGAMVPMRSIPFKVICLLGMDSGTFPRQHRSLSFDRMAEEARPGDRSQREDDRSLFLESLLSARDCLYLSYVGRDIRDHSALPPSVLVSELLEAIERGFLPRDASEGDAVMQVVTAHPLQAFSRQYFTGDSKLFSYAADLCDTSRDAGLTEQRPAPLITVGLPEPGEAWRTVELRRLLAFFRHPTRHFVRERLGIFLEEDDRVLESREPFTLDGLPRYHLRQEILQRHLDGESLPSIQQGVRAAGLLPHGQVGLTLFECAWPGIVRFAQRLRQVLPALRAPSLEIDLHLGAWRLTGQLTDVTPEGLVGYHLGSVRARDYLHLWVCHLVLNCLAPPAVQLASRWIGEDDELRLQAAQEPQACLHAMLEWYWHGLQRPLHLFPDSAFDYAKAQRQGKPDPLQGARRKWEGSEFQRGECMDSYYQLAFRDHDPLDDEFVTVTEAVFLPLFAHLEEAAWRG